MSTTLFSRARSAAERALARGVERLFGGYRQVLHEPDASRPARLARPRRVAVLGGGLAGITAASVLAERGFAVELFERERYLGGKVGAWREAASDGATVPVEHGFHAYFLHYYNQRALFERAGLGAQLRRVDSYLTLKPDGARIALEGPAHPPLVNLVALAQQGLYRVRDLATSKALHRLDPFLRYDAARTFERFDGTSFAQFARDAGLPDDLLLLFNTFSRAFFADPDRMSLAELIKSFHFYYLSHDHGLLYDYLDGPYEAALLAPLRAHLEGLGVELHLGLGARSLAFDGARYALTDEAGAERTFDGVVLACSVPGARALLEASPTVAGADPTLARRVAGLRAGQRYAVVRVWYDRPLGEAALPVFFVTDRVAVLDAVARVDAVDPSARSEEHPTGAVLELHCYAVPDGLDDDAVAEALVREATRFLPSLAGARELRRHAQVRSDFPAFHTGMHAERPGVETRLPGLALAGDWVKLPCPAMLMEAACTAGVLAANALCDREGVRTERVYTVPLRGALAGLGA